MRIREDWDSYFMSLARMVATRATCDRRHVGAVITRDRRIISTGYNGAIAGHPHCDDVGHFIVDNHCIRTTHAEINAISGAAKAGVSTDGATLYITISPCVQCVKALASAGIKRVIYGEMYPPQENPLESLPIRWAKLAGIDVKAL
jgi:dCMP deaminase